MTESAGNERSIFLEALKCESSEERDVFLNEACRNNTDLISRVRELIAAHEASQGPLDTPPTKAAQSPTLDHAIAEQPGDQIGPYRLLQELGRGGMGVVYMAEQSQPVSRRVALKIIKPGMDTRQVIARFEAERQALAMMDHPNIAKVLDAGATESGRPYFVMELVKGLPITHFCDEQHLDPKQRLELFIEVCNAVQHAHQKGIIHRDLKPSNVLVADYDQHAVPKVIDFGVAKATSQKLTEKTMFTQFGQIMGTLEYMSPEQAKLNQLDIDTRSDVYSLGVLLYELLTGDTPFDRKRLYSAAFDEMLKIIREEEPPKPSTRLSSAYDRAAVAKDRAETPERLDRLVKGDLDWIAMRALEKDRARRYSTASNLAEDIERFLNDEVIEARPPSRSYVFRKFVHRNKGAVVAASTLLLTLVIGIAATTTVAFVALNARREAEIQKNLAQDEAVKARKAEAKTNAANEKALQIIMQDALAFGLSGDSERTEDFIDRAKIVGATDADENLIRAALELGLDPQSTQLPVFARRVLDQEPDNVAALALLANSVYTRGLYGELVKIEEKLAKVQPKTPEEFTMLGWHRTPHDARKGLALIEEGLKKHDSGLARAVRGWALLRLALETNDLLMARESMDQATLARAFLGGSRVASNIRMRSIGATYYLSKRSGTSEEDLAELVEEGKLIADTKVKSRSSGSVDLSGAAIFYELCGDIDSARHAWRELSNRPGGLGFLSVVYAPFLFEHESLSAVQQLLDDAEFKPAMASIYLYHQAILSALSGNTTKAKRHLRVIEESGSHYLLIPEIAVIPMILGDRDHAHQILEDALEEAKKRGGQLAHRPESVPLELGKRFLLDELEFDEYLAGAKIPYQRACCYQLAAFKALADGDRDLALERFRASANASFDFFEWYGPWSAGFLAQMERDDTWPVNMK